MASEYQAKLESFMISDIIVSLQQRKASNSIIRLRYFQGKNDFLCYATMFVQLTELLAQKNGFRVYVSVVKNWLIGFEVSVHFCATLCPAL